MKPNQVGKELGISSASFTKWKNGSTPTVDALIKLSEYFDVSIDYLVFGDKAERCIKVDDDVMIITDQNERLLIKHYRALHYVNQIKILSSVIEEAEKDSK
jgi:transcriptional regulator with XRE-family HTH domain